MYKGKTAEVCTIVDCHLVIRKVDEVNEIEFVKKRLVVELREKLFVSLRRKLVISA